MKLGLTALGLFILSFLFFMWTFFCFEIGEWSSCGGTLV